MRLRAAAVPYKARNLDLAMSRPPQRKRSVFFLGAGFSSCAGLPNTAQLLSQVHRLAAEKTSWGLSKAISDRLETAYKFFYPTRGSGFRPEVVDFFTVLSSYLQIDGGGLPEGFSDRTLLSDLRFAIVHLLCETLRQVDDALLANGHDLLDRMIQKGNVVITTNWDTLVERACHARGVPYRLWGAPSDGALTILKLHGSIDWLLKANAKKTLSKANYAHLEDLQNSRRARRRDLVTCEVVRARITRPGAVWQTVKGASKEPYMITMTPGKADALGPLLELWEYAYRSISSAKTLEIVGYSMPEDDVEIRTLLRAGVRRGRDAPKVVIRNPAPDVHVRLREMIQSEVESDYTAIGTLA